MIDDPTDYTLVEGRFGTCREYQVWRVTEVVSPKGYWITLECAYAAEADARAVAQRLATKDKEPPKLPDANAFAQLHINAPYNPVAKSKYLVLGTKYLRRLAKALELPAGSYSVRTCKGGIAVPGECILHGEWLYLQICELCGEGPQIMFRRCKGRKDYSGERNQWIPVSALDDLPAFAEQIKIVLRVDE